LFTLTLTVVGKTETAMAGVTVTAAVADTAVLATDVAATVTFGFAGTVGGAV